PPTAARPASGRVPGALPADRADLQRAARLPGLLPDRALLPLRGRSAGPRLAPGDPPSALAAPGRRGADRAEHDDGPARASTARDGAAAALRGAPGHGRLAARGYGLAGAG